MMIPNDSSNDPAVNRMSIRVVDTADSARATRHSILSLYGHRSYYHKILDPGEGPFAMALELQADYSRVSRIIDDHLEDDLLPVDPAWGAVYVDCSSPLTFRLNHYSPSLYDYFALDHKMKPLPPYHKGNPLPPYYEGKPLPPLPASMLRGRGLL